MKKHLAFILGFTTSAMTVAGVSLASTGVRGISASYANIQIVVNGKTIPTSAEPFIYNYNVYVPVSTVGTALGAKVNWVNRPAEVKVGQPAPVVKALRVFYDGRQLPNGITDGKTYAQIPAATPAYVSATGLVPTVSGTGAVDFRGAQTPSSPSGTPLLSLKPSALYGDFSNTSLYPQGQLGGYWAASVLGRLWPGQSAIQWAASSGQTVQLPGADYALDSRYSTLTGQFAVDDWTKNYGGAVQLVFLGDGKVIGSTGWVQGGQEPAQVSVNVAGVNTLEIQYQLKTPQGNVYGMGQQYVAPGSSTAGQPVVMTDFINAALSGGPNTAGGSGSSGAAGSSGASGGSP